MRVVAYARALVRYPPSYILGRFYMIRVLFSWWMHLRDRLQGRVMPVLNGPSTSPIVQTTAQTALIELRRTALTQCIVLPPALAQEIREFAAQTECLASSVRTAFRYADVKKGRLTDGTLVILAECQQPARCPAVRQIRDDPVLQWIVASYLGYIPRSQDIRLYWSFVGEATGDERRRMAQTIDFHYDIHDYNFCYVHVYLTDATADSGAHVMVPASHRSKPIRWLFGSARQSDQAIEQRYGKQNVLCLEGKAGTGFIEDTSCFHKALIPSSQERLMLQIRYH